MDERSRTVRIPLDVFLKRSWPLIAVGAVLVFIVSAILLWYALSGTGRKQVSSSPLGIVVPTSTTDLTLVPRALDGILVAPTEAGLQPFAVMIDNHPDARPEGGLASASLVFEAPVEGGFTRYMAVFDATSTVDQIGPVRSARPYFVEFADGLNAVYAHVGGSPDALEKIKSMEGFRNLDEMANGRFFWRASTRVAPHQVLTRMDLLKEAVEAKKWNPSRFRTWRFMDDDPIESASGTVRGTTNGPSVAYGGAFNVAWKFDKETNTYLRSVSDRPQSDTNGTRVAAKNVVVMLTDAEVLDGEGRLKLRTTGRGTALLYRNGHLSRLMWRRSSGEHIQFEGVDGTEVVFNRGTTWIQVVTDPKYLPQDGKLLKR